MAGSAVRARTRARAEKRKAAKQGIVGVEPVAQATQPLLRTLLLGGLIAIAVVLAYQQAWHAGYIWDDDLYVTQNPLLTATDGLRRIWFSFDAPSQYFPLTYTTFRIEHALWGFDSSGYHWTNILLHAANALLVWRLLRVLRVPGAWFAAALFALHPVQVESVAWVTERKNVLMGFFFLLSLLAWVRFTDDERRKQSLGWLALSFVLYLLALSAKTTACTLPAALLFILWLKQKPITLRRWLHISPYMLAGLGAGVVSVLWERVHQGGRPDAIPVGSIERVLIGCRAVWFYLSKLTWPAELMFSYPRWGVSRANAADYFWLFAVAVLVAAIVYARRWLGRGPEVAFGFFIATLSPLLGVVIVTTFIYSFVADHYQYLACIGPLTLFAAGTTRFVRRPALAQVGAGFVLLALAWLTWRQAGMYQNEEALWKRTIVQNPGSWMSRNQLGAYLVSNQRFAEAIEQYRKIVELRPNDSLGYMNLGAALAREGNTDAAIVEYERALALSPDDARIERNLGQALFAEGRVADAVTHFQRALTLRSTRDPHGETADLNLELGNAYLRVGGVTAAISHYRRALELRSNYAAAHSNLASALLQKGETAEARRHLEEAKRLDPNAVHSAEVYCEAGNTALQKRDLEGAISNYRQALAIRSDYPEAHSNLGTALLISGKPADAISEFEATLALAPQSVPTLNNLARLFASAPDISLRNPDRAVQLAQRAIELSQRRDPASFRALGLALAAKGDFAEAENAADEAINLSATSSPAFADVVRREKESYRDARAAAGR